MTDITAPQLRAMQGIARRSKGWPIGIPVHKAMARRLVAKGLAEWAPPVYRYTKPVFTVRLTVSGQVALEMAG